MGNDEQDGAGVYQWGKPLNSRRYHIFEDGKSLCQSWILGSPKAGDVEESDSYREGEDCKKCCRRAGVLDDE